MTDTNTIPETAIDPVCGKTINPGKELFSSKDDKGTYYFCSQDCKRRFDTADTKSKKGFWARYTDRLKDTHCTRTPPECT